MSPGDQGQEASFEMLSPIGASFMSPVEQRLECLRIAHTDHTDPKEVVDRARAYLAFVQEEEDPSSEK